MKTKLSDFQRLGLVGVFCKNTAFFNTVEFVCGTVFFFLSREKYEETLGIVVDSLIQMLFHVM